VRSFHARGFGLLAMVLSAGATAAPAPREDALWSYEVTAGPGGRELTVEAQIGGGTDELTVDEGLGAFIQQPQVDRGSGWVTAERRADRLVVGASGPCRVRYRFLLGQAAAEVHDRNRAFAQGAALLAPPSSWLARPVTDTPGRYRFHVATPPVLSIFVSPGLTSNAVSPPSGLDDEPFLQAAPDKTSASSAAAATHPTPTCRAEVMVLLSEDRSSRKVPRYHGVTLAGYVNVVVSRERHRR